MFSVGLPGWGTSWCVEQKGAMHIWPLLLNTLQTGEGNLSAINSFVLFYCTGSRGKAQCQPWAGAQLDELDHSLLWHDTKRAFLPQILCGLSWGAGFVNFCKFLWLLLVTLTRWGSTGKGGRDPKLFLGSFSVWEGAWWRMEEVLGFEIITQILGSSGLLIYLGDKKESNNVSGIETEGRWFRFGEIEKLTWT